MIDTTAVIVCNGDGVGLDQLFSTHGNNGTFINLKVPFDGIIDCIEDRRKGADIVGSISSKRKSVIVACIGIREGKGATVYQDIWIAGQIIITGEVIELGYFARIREVI